ncbi:hypothetical protein FLONG3_4969 [Fusarium longipes]|uniref:Uncharacterized protein n=1 Tax=Fusarium longipes TaxID=694270 RepID=A0A395SXF8_9HYPO|nr:hypothetical protein FLONG3_4969 [Fusarium longipes]
MLYKNLILGFAAPAAAIDIVFWSNGRGTCGDGTWLAWSNINPNSCAIPGSKWSNTFWANVAIRAIPKGWNIRGRGVKNAKCEGNPMGMGVSKGDGQDICVGHTGTSYRSAFYEFIGKKRAVEGQECQEEAKPSELGLEDGSVWDVSSIDEEDLDKLIWNIGPNDGTTSDALGNPIVYNHIPTQLCAPGGRPLGTSLSFFGLFADPEAERAYT